MYKFGKLPAKRSMKMAALSSHMNMKLVSYPKVRAWERPIDLGMLANDKVGDCTVAAMYHLRMTQRSVAQAGKPLIVTEGEALGDYAAITGYNGDPSTDNGANCLDVINWYKAKGVILGASTVDIQNVEMVKAAINTFGCLYGGFTVPTSMVDQLEGGTDPDWSYSASDQATQNGHCVNLVGYGADGFALDSWGKVYRSSWEFLQQWFTELYAIASPDWIKANGTSPSGLDMPGLLAALPQS